MAFGAVCPHQEQSLEEGLIEDGIIFCPRHQFAFDLRTGEHTAGTASPYRFTKFTTKAMRSVF